MIESEILDEHDVAKKGCYCINCMEAWIFREAVRTCHCGKFTTSILETVKCSVCGRRV